MFVALQYLEYKERTFRIRDGVYGRVFYFSTGTHGIHVILGFLFLGYNLGRMVLNHFNRFSHLRFEIAVIY